MEKENSSKNLNSKKASENEKIIMIDDFPVKIIKEDINSPTTDEKDNKLSKRDLSTSEKSEKEHFLNRQKIKKHFSSNNLNARKNKLKNRKISSSKHIYSIDNTPVLSNLQKNENSKKESKKRIVEMDEEDNKKKAELISEQIIQMNREHMKDYIGEYTPEIIRPIKCINLKIQDSDEESEQRQKTLKMKESFRSGSSHKNFLVKINMIGDTNAGKTEFVNIITNKKESKTNTKQAKKALKF